jgi:hypothetical protein
LSSIEATKPIGATLLAPTSDCSSPRSRGRLRTATSGGVPAFTAADSFAPVAVPADENVTAVPGFAFSNAESTDWKDCWSAPVYGPSTDSVWLAELCPAAASAAEAAASAAIATIALMRVTRRLNLDLP